MTVLQIIEDSITEEVWMKVETWGDIKYINLSEWIDGELGFAWSGGIVYFEQ